MKEVKTVGIIGFGVMGAAIGLNAAMAGYRVIYKEMNDELVKIMYDKWVLKSLNKRVEKGKITQEDMDAFHRALDAKNSELRYEFESTKKQHRFDEDAMQREILELQAKKAAIDNGEFLSIAFHATRRCL